MKLKKTIYLTRHGSTRLNARDILQGRKDVPLNEVGKEEALRLALELKNEKIEHIYHSPLKRASETAKIVNKFQGTKLTSVADFVEVDLGDWEELEFREVVENHQGIYFKWSFDPHTKIPGGESFAQVCARIKEDVQKILGEDESSILITAHATLNRALLAVLFDMDYQKARCFRMRNCGLSKFLVYDIGGREKIILDYWNNTSFLREIK